MADTDLPVSGSATQIVVMIDGVIVNVVDQVTSFSAKARYDTITHKPLGTTQVFVDKEPIGWEGDLEVAASRKTLDEMMDTIHAAQRARTPVVVNLRSVTHYKDGTSKSYVYQDVKLEVDTRTRRGEASTVALRWESGLDRVAL